MLLHVIPAWPRLTKYRQIFESPGKIIIGLERLILETIGFDFRTRYPQKLLVKVVRSILGPDEGKPFFNIAYSMSIDMYKTFVPIKRTTFSMVMALVELTARMTGEHLDKVEAFAAQRRQYSRPAVLETMLDILDLYVQYHKSTNVGAQFDLNRFMDIKIALNTELEKEFISRHMYYCSRCENEEAPTVTPGSATSPTATASSWPGDASMRRTARGQDGTMRFVFDPEAAREEQDTVAQYHTEEYEEYEVEVEEPIPPPRYEHGEGGGGRGGYRGGHGHHGSRDRGDHRRGGPYGNYRGDRHYRGRRYH
jgi:CTD kinase subunit beta